MEIVVDPIDFAGSRIYRVMIKHMRCTDSLFDSEYCYVRVESSTEELQYLLALFVSLVYYRVHFGPNCNH